MSSNSTRTTTGIGLLRDKNLGFRRTPTKKSREHSTSLSSFEMLLRISNSLTKGRERRLPLSDASRKVS